MNLCEKDLSKDDQNHPKTDDQKHLKILNIIGSSSKPLTSREIEEKYFLKFKNRSMPKNRRKDSDIYRVLDEITGFPKAKRLELFDFNDLLEKIDKNFKSNLLKKLDRISRLGFTKDEIESIAKKMEIIARNKENLIFPFHYKNKDEYLSIEIEFNKANEGNRGFINLSMNIKGIIKIHYPLYLVEKSNKRLVYVEKKSEPKIRLVECIPKIDKIDKKFKKIQLERKLFPDLREIYKKGFDSVVVEDITEEESRKMESFPSFLSSDYLYCLSFQGFLYYIQKENKIKEIKNVLNGLVNNKSTKKDYMFLDHPSIIDKILEENCSIKILKEVVSLFSKEIYGSNLMSETELKSFIMNTYFSKLSHEISNKIYSFVPSKRPVIGKEDFIKLKEYEINILKQIRCIQKENLKNLNEILITVKNMEI